MYHRLAHPSMPEAARMDLHEASGVLENRIYKAAIVAERFEAAGKYGGNGHHFAKGIARHARKEFERRWHHA